MPSPLPAPSPRQPPPQSAGAGILLMVGAVACFAGLDTTAKWLNQSHDPMATAAVRYVVSFVLVGAAIRPWGRAGLPRTRSLGLQVVRACFLLVATLCSFYAARALPLTQATAISFAGPLVVACVAGPLLGERLGLGRGAAVAVGFVGVLVITRPAGAGFQPAALLALVVAFCNAAYSIATRMLAGRDPSRTTVFYTGLVGAALAGPALPFMWTAPASGLEWTLMLAVGAFGAAGHWLMILAHRLAPASLLAPFNYVQLLWTGLLAALVFGEVPDRWTLLGGAVVIGAGLYLLLGERRRRGA